MYSELEEVQGELEEWQEELLKAQRDLFRELEEEDRGSTIQSAHMSVDCPDFFYYVYEAQTGTQKAYIIPRRQADL